MNDQTKSNFGDCCACGENTPSVRNIICHDLKGVSPGSGWGCVVCGLPPDGAVSVICDSCADRKNEIKFVCVGYPARNERLLVADCREPFAHDLRFHPEVTAQNN